MHNEHQITKSVYEAKSDSVKADDLISAYLPFIRSEAAKHMARNCTEQDDEYSIAMVAFYEAIMGYDKSRGAFLNYAAMLIKSRILDYNRKEARHKGIISIYSKEGDGEQTLADTLADSNDYFEQTVNRESVANEIKEFAVVLSEYGICFSDVADNCPKQSRSVERCKSAIHYAVKTPKVLDDLKRTKRVPLAEIVNGSGADRKTLERHRKYILAMLLIELNGYGAIRSCLHGLFEE